ncbi:MAG: hypothetical protein IPN76_02535 [Saprospiraceae bacterium]|nr:hypothetical protein [Saprospiraceae bacterium]
MAFYDGACSHFADATLGGVTAPEIRGHLTSTIPPTSMQGGEHYVAHLGKLKAEYLFNTKVSLSAFLQYSSDRQIFVENVRFRFNPRRATTSIVFNDILNGNRSRELPQLPFSDSRAVVVKYTYTFKM